MYDEHSLERIVPDQMDTSDSFDRETLRLHLERYSFAIQNGYPGRILDIACGTGYGSYRIMQAEKFSRSQVTAVDIDEDAIEFGRKRYPHDSIRFICADAMRYTDQVPYDTIVSLETIEHLSDPVSFVKKLHSLLSTDGMLIVSAPVTPSTDGNPHHLSDFSAGGFKRLFENSGFIIQSLLLQEQSYSLSEIFHSPNKRLAQKRRNIGKYYLSHPGLFIARIRSLIMDGLKNKYLTLAMRKG